jgi:hypothetical protein
MSGNCRFEFAVACWLLSMAAPSTAHLAFGEVRTEGMDGAKVVGESINDGKPRVGTAESIQGCFEACWT